MRKKVRYMTNGYGRDWDHKEYSLIYNILHNEIKLKCDKLLSQNKEVQALIKKINENNETFFDKKTEEAFQVNCGYTDDYGEDYLDFRFEPLLYKQYLNYVHNFSEILGVLQQQKEKLEKGFHFRKKEKIAEINERIQQAHLTREEYLKIYEREQKFKEVWFKDGVFVDLNADYKARIEKIKSGILKQLAEKCIDKHPELMMYDFEYSTLPDYIEKAIIEAQKTRKLKTEKVSADEQDAGSNFNDEEREIEM